MATKAYIFSVSGVAESDRTAQISSTNAAETNPNNAIDGDNKTFVHSMDVLEDKQFDSFPTLNITLG